MQRSPPGRGIAESPQRLNNPPAQGAAAPRGSSNSRREFGPTFEVAICPRNHLVPAHLRFHTRAAAVRISGPGRLALGAVGGLRFCGRPDAASGSRRAQIRHRCGDAFAREHRRPAVECAVKRRTRESPSFVGLHPFTKVTKCTRARAAQFVTRATCKSSERTARIVWECRRYFFKSWTRPRETRLRGWAERTRKSGR
jgi:hypothetical protein